MLGCTEDARRVLVVVEKKDPNVGVVGRRLREDKKRFIRYGGPPSDTEAALCAVQYKKYE